MIRTNAQNGIREFITKGTIISINNYDIINSNGAEIRESITKIKLPNGLEEEINTYMFTSLLKDNKDAFKVGVRVEVAIEVPNEDLGKARIQLPTLQETDVSMLLVDTNAVNKTNNKYNEIVREKVESFRQLENGKSYTWVKVILFLFGLLFVSMILSGAINGVSKVLSSIPWYVNLILTIGGIYVFTKLIK